MNGVTNRRVIVAIASAAILVILMVVFFVMENRQSGTDDDPVFLNADPQRGMQALDDYGCTGCHMVPGIRDADGLVGPTLHYWADRQFIAGKIRNTPDNLVSWIMAPQAIEPGTAMPDMGVTWGDARDMAAYLWTLRYNQR